MTRATNHQHSQCVASSTASVLYRCQATQTGHRDVEVNIDFWVDVLVEERRQISAGVASEAIDLLRQIRVVHKSTGALGRATCVGCGRPGGGKVERLHGL